MKIRIGGSFASAWEKFASVIAPNTKDETKPDFAKDSEESASGGNPEDSPEKDPEKDQEKEKKSADKTGNWQFPNPFGGKKDENAATGPDPAVKREADQLKRELKELQNAYQKEHTAYQQNEREFKLYHKICDRCIQPLQYLLGYCRYSAGKETDVADLYDKINERYLSLLITAIENCGLRIEADPAGKTCNFVKHVDVQRYDTVIFQNTFDIKQLTDDKNDLLARMEKLSSDQGFLQKTYGYYRQVCITAARYVGELIYYCQSDLSKVENVQAALDRLNHILCSLSNDLSEGGCNLRILYFEDLPEGKNVQQWFNLVDKGYLYPAILKGGELFFDAYGQVRQKSTGPT